MFLEKKKAETQTKRMQDTSDRELPDDPHSWINRPDIPMGISSQIQCHPLEVPGDKDAAMGGRPCSVYTRPRAFFGKT